MIGNLVHGQSAEKGTLMLGEIEIGGITQRVFSAPVRIEGNAHCLVVPISGRAFCPSSAWIRQTMWDVTSAVEFAVELQNFSISSAPPRHGEIAYLNGDWLIAATIDEHKADRPEWIDVAAGEPVRPRADLLRFTGWQLRIRGAAPQTQPLFQAFPPPQEPFLMVAG
ncbi:MAG: hypothetical protein NT015_09675 [Alphaproteobacteria bacterium]|nr:hypothetical protein [Alphaproteobacteria bacterium]